MDTVHPSTGRSGKAIKAMTSISLHELNQHSDHIVRTVASTGKTVTITDRNRPIARVVPVSHPNSRVQQLVAAGILSHTPAPYPR